MSILIYEDLTFILRGIFFEVYNHYGSGYREKTYCDAIAKLFDIKNIEYKREIKFPLKFYNEEIGNRYFDFLVGNKVIVEVKIGNKNSRRDFEQIREYLIMSDYKLGLLVLFRDKDVKVYRVPNLYKRSNGSPDIKQKK